MRVFDERTVRLPEGSRATVCADVAECVSTADVVFEAVHEELDAKRKLIGLVQAAAGPIPVASNTSTFCPSELTPGLRYPGSVLVAHFFNPADVVPLVEVVPGPLTTASAQTAVRTFLTEANKAVITLEREIEGFVANR